MHELSRCRAIAGAVRPHAAGRRVDIVRIRVGALPQVVPDGLSFCWTLVRDVEDMASAELELELIPAEVSCRSCGAEAEVASRVSVVCPGCGGGDVVVHGEEFLVTSIEIGDAAAAESSKGIVDG